uniref:Pre-mRNA splicing Prp18-interacting factor n=1 Tax=Tanacetum cinerariifolium TaxID=118510 RepID=A0A6L2JVR4_TANCI|nr:hypothetical protein [Tanacetum cinerariifolium]
MSLFNQRECLRCGQPCDGLYCYPCTCQQCGVGLTNGICLNFTYRDGKPLICCECEGPLRGEFCWFCNSRAETSFANNPNLNSFNESQNLSDCPPQPQYETYPCELCGNDSHYGYDFPPRFSLVYEQEPSYNQNDNDNYYPHNSPSFLCCDNCEESLQNFKIIHKKSFISLNNTSEISPVIANTPDLPTEEPEDSLSMGDEHLSTITKTESDEVIKSSVENLVPIPSESEVTSENDNTLIDSSPKFDYLLKEFSGELAHINLIPSGIEEADFDLEEEIRLVENLLYDNSSPRPSEELNAEIADMIRESLSPSLIPVEDSDSHKEEIDLFLATNDLMPPGIENDDYDSERGYPFS